MSKIKRAAAIVAAAVLCMSMSVGAFASSPTDPEQIVNDGKTMTFSPIWMSGGTDKDGNQVTAYSVEALSQEVKEILSDEEKVKEILYQAGYTVEDGQKITVLAADDISLIGKSYFEAIEVPEGGVDLDLQIGYEYKVEGSSYREWSSNLDELHEGDTVYVLHQKADGTWEVMEGTVQVKTVDNGYGTSTSYYVTAHFDTLSPVAVIKVMSNGEVVVLDKNENYKGTIDVNAANKGDGVKGEAAKVVKTTVEKKSPKTGN